MNNLKLAYTPKEVVDWFPMEPQKGPPLPRFLELYWPWYKPSVPTPPPGTTPVEPAPAPMPPGMTPEQQEIYEQFLENWETIKASPLPTFQECYGPWVPGTKTFNLQVINEPADTHIYAWRYYCPQPYGLPENWWKDPVDGVATVPLNQILSAVRVFATIGIISGPYAQSGAIPVSDGLTIVFDATTKEFKVPV